MEALESLRAVVSDGKLYLKEDLDASIAEFQAFYEKWLIDWVSVLIAKRRLETVTTSYD